MPIRLTHLVVDAADPAALARFWSAALGWPVTYEDAPARRSSRRRTAIRPRPASYRSSSSPSTIRRRRQEPGAPRPGLVLRRAPGCPCRPLGVARRPPGRHRPGRRTSPGSSWPTPTATSSAWSAIAARSARTPRRLRRPRPGRRRRPRQPRPRRHRPVLVRRHRLARSSAATATTPGSATPTARGPYLDLRIDATPKTAKLRVHLDVAPYPGDDHAAELHRLLALGARPTDIGQGDAPWTVLADPDGNELCLLTPF